MSDAITFDCTGCGMPYRVASSYAGREFNCKQCGAHLCVPQPGESAGIQFESNVELDSGSEVMRRTTPSGRQVRTDPTRVFQRQRESSARMGAVNRQAPTADKKSSKAPLFAVIAVVLVLAIGLGAAFALGAFDSKPAGGNQSVAQTNEPATTVHTDSARDRILKQLDVSGQPAAKFVELLKQAEEAKLDNSDLALVGRKMVAALNSEEGAGYSDAELLAFADRMNGLNASIEAKTLYKLVIRRNRDKADKSDEYAKARMLLGDTWLDFSDYITRATELRDSGVIDGADKLRQELSEIEGRADDGWAGASDAARFGELVKLVDSGVAELERIKQEDPFRLTVAKASVRFNLEKTSHVGAATWVTIGVKPYIFHCQQLYGESEADTRKRLQKALDAAAEFSGFFRTVVADPLNLKRMLPSGETQAERDAAPFEVLLFRDAGNWTPYLKDRGVRVEASSISSLTEPGSGRISMVYEDEAKSLGKFVRMLVDDALYNYHPHAPTTAAEDSAFKSFHGYWLDNSFASALSYVTINRTSGRFTFFLDDRRVHDLMAQLLAPYNVSETNGKINSFGGPAFTAKQLAGLTRFEDAEPLLRANLESYGGWDDTYLTLVTSSTNVRGLIGSYMHALILFTYYGGGDDHPYRDNLLQFVRMDLADEIDAANPLPAFEKAFGLDEAGWKAFEADFLNWQKGD